MSGPSQSSAPDVPDVSAPGLAPAAIPAAPPAPATAVHKRRWLPANRWLRGTLYGVASLFGLWLLSWLALPPLLKWQGEKIAGEQLGRAVRIGAVEFKPWTLELSLHDVAVAGADGAPDQFSIQRIHGDLELESIIRLAPVLDAVQIESPALRLTHLGEGRYDIDDILARLAERPQPSEPGAPARFALYNIELKDGRIDFDDRSVGRQHELRDLQLTLPFISNLPAERQIKVQPQLAFVANGSAFNSSAEALPFDPSRQTDAALRLRELDLAPYLGYIPAGLPIRLKAAMVDADLQLGFEQTPKPSLRLGGTLTVSGLKSVDAQGADALAFDGLKLQLGEVRPLERRLHLAAVELSGPQLTVRRDQSGQINLLVAPGAEAAVPPAAPASAAATAAPAAPAASAAKVAAAPVPGWEVAIDKLSVHGGTVDFHDDSTANGDTPAAALRLNEFELQAASIGWPFTQPLSFSGSAALVGTEGLTPTVPAASPPRTAQARRKSRRKGKPDPVKAAPEAAVTARPSVPSIEFQGSAGAQSAEVNARVASIPLALAAPYLAPHLVPRLTGDLDAHVGLQWAPPKASDLPHEIKIAAEQLTLRQLMLADAPSSADARPAGGARAVPARKRRDGGDGPLASIDRIDLSDVLVDLRTRAVSVGRLGLQSPRTAISRDADKKWMVEAWLRQPAGDDKPADAPKPRTGPNTDFPWKVVVNELALVDGTIGWHDGVPASPVEAELTQLQLDAKKIDLSAKQAIPVNLSARIGAGRAEPGRLSWRGQFGLTPVAAQGAVEAQRLPVHAFEPYFGDALNVDLLRADTSFKGQVAFTQTAQGPRVRVNGDASVEELRTHSRPGTAAAPDAQQPPAAEAGAGSSTQRDLGGTSTTTAQAAARPVAAGNGARGGLGEELLSWKALRLGGLDVQLEPGKPAQIEVKDTLLSDFYARLIIHPNGRINLQDVMKSAEGDAASAAPPPATTARAPAPSMMPAAGEFSGEAASGSAPPASAAPPVVRQVDPMAPVIRVGPVRLANGKVLFSDRFIRPNYSADLTELNGSLGTFSSIAPAGAPQMAELQLTGRAEGTAALEVSGQLNPLANPLALDIKGKVTDLELPPLSPYSVRYAGHGIERGKLSMEVEYEVQPDGRLTASNRLVLNQLEFGEPVQGAPASLPVKLATALLADSKGVIDLDLPISGSLNDPQFSIGPIIFKAVVGLIGRAITAPFTLLARALGGGGSDDLSHVAFAPGSAQLGPKAREQLDKIAKALADRPQLRLTVVGTARLDVERAGYRRERLQALVAAEKRGDAGGRATDTPAPTASAPQVPASAASAPASAAPGVAVFDAEYPELLKRLYRRANIPERPRNAIGMLRDVPVEAMETMLMAHIEVTEDAMRQLAVQRGTAVKDYLAGKNLPAERLFLGAARTGQAAAQAGSDAASAAAPAEPGSAAPPKQTPWSPRAELALAAR